MSEQATTTRTSPIIALGGALLAAFGAWYYLGGGIERHAAHNMQRVEQQVAADSVAKYEMAKRSGSPMDACAYAGMVAVAHLEAKDEPGYRRWKAVEEADCKAAEAAHEPSP